MILRLFADIYLFKMPLWADETFGAFVWFSFTIGTFSTLIVIMKSFFKEKQRIYSYSLLLLLIPLNFFNLHFAFLIFLILTFIPF